MQVEERFPVMQRNGCKEPLLTDWCSNSYCLGVKTESVKVNYERICTGGEVERKKRECMRYEN